MAVSNAPSESFQFKIAFLTARTFMVGAGGNLFGGKEVLLARKLQFLTMPLRTLGGSLYIPLSPSMQTPPRPPRVGSRISEKNAKKRNPGPVHLIRFLLFLAQVASILASSQLLSVGSRGFHKTQTNCGFSWHNVLATCTVYRKEKKT